MSNEDIGAIDTTPPGDSPGSQVPSLEPRPRRDWFDGEPALVAAPC